MPDIQQYSVSIKFKTEGSESAEDKVKKLEEQIDKLKKSSKSANVGKSIGLDKIGAMAGKFGGILKGAVFTAGGAALTKLGQNFGNLTKQTMDYIETVNLFRTSMGDLGDEAMKFVNRAESDLGMDPKTTMDSIASFQNLSEGIGIASDRAYIMSKNLTQLSADLSSLANIPFEQAQQKMLSGFSGQIKPLIKYGIALDQASLQETAYSLGIEQKVKTMTKAQKTELIYYQIMKSSQKIQGDLGKSLLSPANALRVMQTEFTKLGRAVGSIFIPMLMRIIPVVRAVTQVLTQAAEAIAKLFGFEMSNYESDLSSVGNLLKGVADDIDGVGDSAGDTTKKLNKMLMPFDELNNLTSSNKGSSGGAGAGGLSGGSLGIDLPEYDMFASIDTNIKDMIEKGNWYDIGKTIGQKLTEGLKKIPWDTIKNEVEKIAKNITGFLNGGIQNTDWKLVGNTIAQGINTVFTFLKTFITTFDFKGTGKAIRDTVMGFFENINWDDIGGTLSSGLIGVLDFAIGTFTNFDVDKIYEAIDKIVKKIDWLKILPLFQKFITKGIKYSPFVLIIKGTVKIIESAINMIIDLINKVKIPIPKELQEWLGLPEEIGFNLKHIETNTDKTIDGIIDTVADGMFNIEEEILGGLGLIEKNTRKFPEKMKKNIEKTFSKNSFLPTIQKNLDVGDKAEKWGRNNIRSFAKGIESKKESVYNKTQTIQNGLNKRLDYGDKAFYFGLGIPTAYSQGMLDGLKKEDGIKKATDTLEDLVKGKLDKKDESKKWGIDLITGLDSGIKEAAERLLKKTMGTVAKMLGAQIHFSKPDEGPLRDYEKWMPDMIKGLSDTLMKSSPMLEKTMSEVSIAMEKSFKMPISDFTMQGEISSELINNIRSKATITNETQTATTIADATYNAVSRALFESKANEKEQLIQVNIGNEKVYRGYGQYKDERSNMLGINLG